MQTDEFAQWLKCGTIFSLGKERVLVAWGQRSWSEKPLGSCIPNFYFPDYFLKAATPWFNHPYYLEIPISELQELLLCEASFSRIKKYTWQNPHQDLFYQTFHEVQKKIRSGQLIKVVPYVMESTPVAMDQNQLVKSLRSVLEYLKNNLAHLYGFWDGNEGILGASPEILFQCDKHGSLKTMACAGTRSLLNDVPFFPNSKELDEHEWVVRGIQESLRSYGEVVVGERYLLKLSKLVHLATPISMQLTKKAPFLEIVKALHPTPAVGAFPKKKGHLWLEEYQKEMDRKRYGAPVGYWLSDSQSSNCYVALRNVQWNRNEMQIAAGCGVVSGSQCDQEWEEINLKLKAVKEMLAL